MGDQEYGARIRAYRSQENEGSHLVGKGGEMTGIWSRFAGTSVGDGLDYWLYFGIRLVEHAAIGSGVDVLDVGCGAFGSSLFPAAAKVGKHGHVIGIDICEH